MYITVNYIQLIQNVTINHLRNPRVFSPLLSKQIWKATIGLKIKKQLQEIHWTAQSQENDGVCSSRGEDITF